jgi:PKD repeat protein
LFYPDLLGTYVLSLVVFDGTDYSAPSKLSVTVSVNQPPTAIAAADVLSGPAPLTVQFDGSGSFDPEGVPLVYAWAFGDGTDAAYVESPAHVFTDPGIFTVLLQVTDDFNNSAQDVLVVEVSPATNNAPTLDPVATPNNGGAPLTVTFDARASDTDGDPLSYAWDFGDPTSIDNTSTLAAPSHIYEHEGSYVAWVTVSDGQDEASASVDIVVAAQQEVSVRKARVVASGERGCRKGNVSLWADVSFGTLSGDDTISVIFDGVELFAARISDFRTWDHSPALVLAHRDVIVKIDPVEQTLFVQRRRVSLFGSDLANGVSVTVLWGDRVAVDQFTMAANHGDVWNYERDSNSD